jgi:hypothetical protein
LSGRLSENDNPQKLGLPMGGFILVVGAPLRSTAYRHNPYLLIGHEPGVLQGGSPEQRLMGIHDSYELALNDWMGTAAFDRDEDHWPRK